MASALADGDRRIAHGEAAPEHGEVRAPVGGEVHELAVQDHAATGNGLGERSEFGKLGAAVATGTRAHAPAARAVDTQLGADAVELDFDRPLVVAGARGRAGAQ